LNGAGSKRLAPRIPGRSISRRGARAADGDHGLCPSRQLPGANFDDGFAPEAGRGRTALIDVRAAACASGRVGTSQFGEERAQQLVGRQGARQHWRPRQGDEDTSAWERGSDKGQPRPAPPTLGLSDIEQRLRDTHAIGVFTKISLKNQIDDLLGQLRAYQLKPTVASLPELRHRYDELLQKVIGLLRSGDPSLAKDISSSREAIWSLLTDSTTISQL
jgi:hypothetical protein